MSKIGFYSIVEKPKGTYQVRSRHEQDLKNLKYLAGLDSSIKKDEGTDYEYRIHVDRESVTKIMSTLGDTIDYSNFKSEVGKHEDQDNKLDAYHSIWAALLYTTTSWLNYRLPLKGNRRK